MNRRAWTLFERSVWLDFIAVDIAGRLNGIFVEASDHEPCIGLSREEVLERVAEYEWLTGLNKFLLLLFGQAYVVRIWKLVTYD